MVSIAKDHLASNQKESEVKKVLRIIKETANGIGKNDLTRKTQWLSRRDRSDILETLVDSGQVELHNFSTGGRAKTVLRATASK